jgi:pectin methylesterase-like acyl-CoA thioesterase
MKAYFRIGSLLACAGAAAAQQIACAVLTARPASAGPDTARIQAALNLCGPGRAVVLKRDGNNARFQSAPLILPREVTLFIDRGVTLYASRHPRDYDLAPGSCGAPPAGKAASCKPFLFAYQAAFSGVSGPGAIDGQGDVWKSVPRGAAVPDLVSSYESQGFHIEGVTLRNAAGMHAAIYKTTALEVSDLKIDSAAGDGLLLSNTAGAAIRGLWIRVPGEALALKASILGGTTGIHIHGLHIFGGRGIALGDETYSPVRDVTVEEIAMDGAAPGFAFQGGQTQAIQIQQGCGSPAAPGAPWDLQDVASANCANPPFSAAPQSTLTADLNALPAPGKARSLVVAQDGSAPFTTVQQAVDALPVTGGEIAVKPGTYREVVTIRKPHVHLHGADPDPAKTVIVYNHGPSYAGTFGSGTVYVEADDATIDHLTIANDLGSGHGQGVALAVTADRAIFRHVRFLGAQDTLFASSRYCYGDYGPCAAARQYFEDCYIEGNTDFIFGDAMAVFERCELHGIAQGSVMYTAQSRHTAGQRDSGYVFDRCRLTGAPREGVISLGRPWRPYATVVFLHTRIDAPVIPAGWTEWPRFGKPSLPTAFYAEYDSTGPGANPKARHPLSKQLTPAEAEKWSPRQFLKGWDPGR